MLKDFIEKTIDLIWTMDMNTQSTLLFGEYPIPQEEDYPEE